MALDYLHSKLVAHRDLKPENIFLNSTSTIVKVADFGISKNLKNASDCSTRTLGTWSYNAPEIVSGNNQSFNRTNGSITSRSNHRSIVGMDNAIESSINNSRIDYGNFLLIC